MKQSVSRAYSCKDEELPVVSQFGASNLESDMTDFSDYSQTFTTEYLNDFKTNIKAASELVAPESETMELKKITGSLHASLDGLINPINHLKGYLLLSKEMKGVTAKDFGLVALRKSIRNKDAEAAMDCLHTVNTNIAKYKTELTAKGLNDALIATFAAAAKTINDDNQRQYTILKNRQDIVQNNVGLLNNLYAQLTEILKVGKILYSDHNPAKAKQYSFIELKKNVRTVHKTVKKDNGTTA